MKRKLFLTSVVIALSVLFFGAIGVCAETYDKALGLWYEIYDEEVRITDCDTSVTELIIPSSYENYPVISVSAYAFDNCTSLKSIDIPDSVTYIGQAAFSGCINLESINISNNTTEIGAYAFENCKNLKEITLPDNISSIGSGAFYNCTSLESIKLPENLTIINKSTFGYCENLLTADIGSKVTSIADSAFSNCINLKEIYIPSSVTSIGRNAFDNCTCLKKVNVESIVAWCNISFPATNSNPLSYANNLYLNNILVENLTIPDSVTEINRYAFYKCTSLRSIDIPITVYKIGNSAFRYCTNIEEITIPKSITSIEDYAFANCTGIKSTTMENGVSNVGSGAFYNCTNLEKVNITNIKTWCNISFISEYSNPLYYAHNLYLNGIAVKNLVIPDEVSEIKDYAFISCESIESVNIPESVLKIGRYAFNGCDSIIIVDIKDIKAWCSIDFYDSSSNPATSSNLSLNGILITNLYIPDSISEIKNYAFYGCRSLERVYLPDSIKKIGDRSFYYCTNLQSINIPNSIIAIGEQAFYACSFSLTRVDITDISAWCNIIFADANANPLWHSNNLYLNNSLVEHLIIPEKVAKIDNYAFANYNKLKSIQISNSITSIGTQSFGGCDNLTDIYYLGTEEQFSQISVEEYNEPFSNASVHYLPYTDTSISEDGKDFVIEAGNLENGDLIFLALYNDNKLVELKTFVYGVDDLTYSTDTAYTDARVMVWNDEDSINPITYVEKVK